MLGSLVSGGWDIVVLLHAGIACEWRLGYSAVARLCWDIVVLLHACEWRLGYSGAVACWDRL
jgi:hypothetical protein